MRRRNLATRRIFAANFRRVSEQQIIGVRDPFGFRPHAFGRLDGTYVLSG